MSKEAITELLGRWQDGDEGALAELLPYLHTELKRLAGRYMQDEAGSHTLQSTALVNEAYLRLVDADVEVASRQHFLAIAARVMRRILVDHARSKHRQKRGGGVKPLALEESIVLAPEGDPRLVDLDEALIKLERFDARLARTVELVYFGGLTTQQAADALGISRVTLNKDLNLARAWLHNEIG